MRHVSFLVLAALCLSACGSKGPLYLPPPANGNPASVQPDNSKATAPASVPSRTNP